jgi:hypothetical protein
MDAAIELVILATKLESYGGAFVPNLGDRVNLVSDRVASYAMHGAGAIVLVNVMRIPCFGRRMTIGRASIVWPGTN